MIVHLHACCWNEEMMLPFFFRHYDPIVDHYYVYDNGSSDRSLAILNGRSNVTVKPLDLPGDCLIEASVSRINELWKTSRGVADWVVCCNVDEFFYHKHSRAYLEQCRELGVTFIPSTGYEMVTDEFPQPTENLCRTRRFGAPVTRLDKPSFFNPNLITESGFSVGRHKASPEGRVVFPEQSAMLLLHYKHLGLPYLTARHRELNARRRPGDVRNRYGHHYDPEETLRRYREVSRAAVKVLEPDGEPIPRPPDRSANLIKRLLEKIKVFA